MKAMSKCLDSYDGLGLRLGERDLSPFVLTGERLRRGLRDRGERLRLRERDLL